MSLVEVSKATIEVLQELGLSRAIDIFNAREAFDKLGFGSNVVVLDYRNGCLVLGVYNSVWHHELEALKDKIVEQLKIVSNGIVIKTIEIKEIA